MAIPTEVKELSSSQQIQVISNLAKSPIKPVADPIPSTRCLISIRLKSVLRSSKPPLNSGMVKPCLRMLIPCLRLTLVIIVLDRRAGGILGLGRIGQGTPEPAPVGTRMAMDMDTVTGPTALVFPLCRSHPHLDRTKLGSRLMLL
jgi:hypothetical protein